MTLTLDLPHEIAAAAEDLARRAGVTPEELLLDTLRRELVQMPESLEDELRLWELASEEDIATFKEREGLD